MKKCGRCALLLMLFLALGVAARETPEIFDLADDVSNDGMAVRSDDHHSQLALRALYPHELARTTLARPSAFPKAGKKHFWFGPSLDASSKAGRIILQFLSIELK